MTSIPPPKHPVSLDSCSDVSLELLLAAALAGNQQAYAHFLRQCLPYLQGCARQLVDANMRDDLVQETLIAIHKVKHTYDANAPVRPWLAGIMRFKAKEAWRKVKNRNNHVSLDDESISAIEAQYQSTMDSESKVLNLVEFTAQITRYLKPDSAQALIATKIDGHSIESTAKAMGKTSSWVKVTVHRAIKTLRNELMEALK